MRTKVIHAAPMSVSEKPWSDYTAADYTPEQWHNACLIHNHAPGASYSKADCKLPVKTPTGIVNKSGVFAAAGALAGARGGVNATSDQKKAAAKTLASLYSKMGEKPPPSVVQLTHAIKIDNFLDHHGVKGQKWGIRNKRTVVRKGRKGKPSRSTVRRQAKSMSEEDLNKHVKRMELEKRYIDLSKHTGSSGKKYASDLLQNNGKTIAGSVVGTATAFAVKRALEKKFGKG
jgi:hypothetical protein